MGAPGSLEGRPLLQCQRGQLSAIWLPSRQATVMEQELVCGERTGAKAINNLPLGGGGLGPPSHFPEAGLLGGLH